MIVKRLAPSFRILLHSCGIIVSLLSVIINSADLLDQILFQRATMYRSSLERREGQKRLIGGTIDTR